MKIATWNINSVRLRREIVSKFLLENNIDILCLQETKTEDATYPKEFFDDIGYGHQHFSGQKSYNGVAIISKIPFETQDIIGHINDDKRDISVSFQLENDEIVELHNFYIPAGGDEPDVDINPKFKHKLEYIDSVKNWFKKNRTPKNNIIIVGDFNIAPYEHDVWSHKQLLKIVSHTPIEVEKLNDMKSSIGFVDVAREFILESQKLYSWWSYRNRDWRKSNRGRRLDHIWVTEPLKSKVKNFEITTDLRDWEKPSDHVPVIIEI